MADPVIRVHEDLLECVTSFAYLGSHLASNACIDSELQHRISAANCSFVKYSKRIYDSRDLSKETKLLAYKAFVLHVLLYSAETWTFYRRHITQLEHFQQRCLCTILHIHWSDRRTNISVLESACLPSIESMIRTDRTTDRQTDTSTDNKGRLDLSGDARANKPVGVLAHAPPLSN